MAKSMRRRQFLKTAAAASAVFGAPNVLRAGGGSNQIVVGVMGTGGRGTQHATSFARLQGVTVAYCCDVDQARAGRATDAVRGAAPKGTQPAQSITDFRRILDDRNINVFTC